MGMKHKVIPVQNFFKIYLRVLAWGSTAGASDASPVCPDLEARRLKWPLLLLGLSLPDSPFEIYKREIQIQFNAPLST